MCDLDMEERLVVLYEVLYTSVGKLKKKEDSLFKSLYKIEIFTR